MARNLAQFRATLIEELSEQPIALRSMMTKKLKTMMRQQPRDSRRTRHATRGAC